MRALPPHGPSDDGFTRTCTGAGGNKRYACATLHGPVDDIGVEPHEANYQATHGMGSDTKLRQRTQVEDPGRSGSHRTPRTLDTPCGLSPIYWPGVGEAGGSQTDTQCPTLHEWHGRCQRRSHFKCRIINRACQLNKVSRQH